MTVAIPIYEHLYITVFITSYSYAILYVGARVTVAIPIQEYLYILVLLPTCIALETSLFFMILMVSPGKRFMILSRSNSGDILRMIRMSSPTGYRFIILISSPGNLWIEGGTQLELG